MYARIEDKVVVFVMSAPPETVFEPGYASAFVAVPDGVDVGWVWDGEAFVPPPPAPPPSRCTRRQGRLALLAAGHLAAVEAAIAAIADPAERMAAQIEYEADTWELGNAFLQQMWAQLGGTPDQLGDLFAMAVTL